MENIKFRKKIPAIVFRTITQSSIHLVSIPGTSIELTKGIIPYLESKP